jgi:hypothetical protein
MADQKRPTADDTASEGATPPGGGETNHETMRASARRPISGPGASDFLAASGGLDLPGVDPSKGTSALRDETPFTDPARLTLREGPDHEPIPGERDPDTLTGSQTGTVGGGGFGAHNPSPTRATGMDDETVAEREREGGGAPRERRRED